jgi:hypothetical protein
MSKKTSNRMTRRVPAPASETTDESAGRSGNALVAPQPARIIGRGRPSGAARPAGTCCCRRMF